MFRGLSAIFFTLFAFNCSHAEAPAPTQGWFDVHIHYSHDVWEQLPAQAAIQRLRSAGITRALVSSSSDEGTQRLFQVAPELVIPALRPYRKRGELGSWMYDETVPAYLEQRLAQFRYAAIGEFHLEGEEADLPVPRRLVTLAKQHQLILHAHVDADAIRRLFAQDPQARILWAHAGFEHASTVEELLDRYPNLWADLSFRSEIYLNARFLEGWRDLLIKHADRFMIGVDTYTPERWNEIGRVLAWYESLLQTLPADVAQRIARGNAQRVIATGFDK